MRRKIKIPKKKFLGNIDGSKGFREFLELIGTKVRLQGFEGYRGDLNVKNDATGKYSYYTKIKDCEIMFHVSTLLPHDPNDSQQIPRKKYIGNDLVTLVYQEEGGRFTPPCVSGDFLHVFIVVQPCTLETGETGYQLAMAARDNVPKFGPPLPCPPYFKKDDFFVQFLLAKIVNAEKATLHSPYIASKMRRTRQLQLHHLLLDCENIDLDTV
eukprot:TRINITY_DN14042_c0_g1_i1.p1 TRINITY_DN14042_c0_g1~~TRINITY_DN14042_c0_g1_i1.p1  ORF type:complete len:212 (-),score=29.48 TRINITY_DN14042_c0_g1_i1:41-676(-)